MLFIGQQSQTCHDNLQHAEFDESGESRDDVTLLGALTEDNVVEVMFYFTFP